MDTQQQKFIDESEKRVADFLKNGLLSVFNDDLTAIIGGAVSAYIDDDDPGTVKFGYPRTFEDSSILQVIRLEFGALAAWTPAQYADVKPYAAAYYPAIFHQPTTKILTITAERTFWEKATILHQEAHRPESSKIPERYSRHYYDFYCMANKGILEKALAQQDLLTQVAKFKRTLSKKMGSIRMCQNRHTKACSKLNTVWKGYAPTIHK